MSSNSSKHSGAGSWRNDIENIQGEKRAVSKGDNSTSIESGGDLTLTVSKREKARLCVEMVDPYSPMGKKLNNQLKDKDGRQRVKRKKENFFWVVLTIVLYVLYEKN